MQLGSRGGEFQGTRRGLRVLSVSENTRCNLTSGPAGGPNFLKGIHSFCKTNSQIFLVTLELFLPAGQRNSASAYFPPRKSVGNFVQLLRRVLDSKRLQITERN